MADLPRQPLVHQCPCHECRERPRSRVAQQHRAINQVLASLNERRRRLLAGLLAQERGHGGVVAVARITGLSRTTIRRGLVELRQGDRLPLARVRAPGGGRPRAEKKIRPW